MPRPALLALLLTACGAAPALTPTDAATDAATDVSLPPLPERRPGERAPRTAECDPADPARCLLPWPSDTFTERAETATGLRLRVAQAQSTNGDDMRIVGRADGFSRATPVITIVPGVVDRASLGDGESAALRVVCAEPGEGLGNVVPVRMHALEDDLRESPATMLIAYPRRPLRPASEHVAVLMDSVRTEGSAPGAEARTRVILGRVAPMNADERALFAWGAPVRRALAAAGIDPARVVRAWTFTTRSAEQPRRALRAIRAAMVRAVEEGRARVNLRTVRPGTGDIALAVVGTLEGLPDPLGPDNRLQRTDDGAIAFGRNDFSAPFRVLVPRGTGDYPVLIWGHGTGGSVDDDSFDREISAARAAKLNLEFEGWTGDRVIETFARFTRILDGVDESSARLTRALGGGAALVRALLGDAMGRGAILGDVLAAPTILGMPNPAAGRRPLPGRLLYTGGSLGGTLGAVVTRSEPRVLGAVLNVPGAAWTHFTPFANLFALLRSSLRQQYGSEADLFLFLSMTQSIWDEVDGAAWADAPDNLRAPVLLQQSMGDPVLPNAGTEFLAAALGATQVGAVLAPIAGARVADEVTAGPVLTQYRVPARVTDALDIHGFAARDSIAGRAAREQFFDFAQSVLAGAPRATVPSACRSNAPAGSCDFRAR